MSYFIIYLYDKHINLSNRTAYYFSDTSFNLLMQKRIRKVLVLCSNYDFFTLEEDGRIDEQIFNEYVSLNLRYPPVFLHADSAEKALLILDREDIDLIIPMLSIKDVDTFKFAKLLKEKYPQTPIVVLTHFSREVSLRLEKVDLSGIDHVFCWLGNTDIFLAIIKLIEDKMNAENDILNIGVQAILLVEDSVRYMSSYLPNLYRIILEQSKEVMKEALNEHQQMLRRRGRPKILVANNYDNALELFNKYRNNLLGIISDVSYKYRPDRRDTKTKAGLRLCRTVKKEDPNIPFLLQSSDSSNEAYAKVYDAGFLNKYSENLLIDLKDYVISNFGFGSFHFINPETNEVVSEANNLKEFQELILSIPNKILEYHTRHDDISKWLNARALFPIARKFKDAQYDDFATPDAVRKYIYDGITSYRVSKARGVIAEFDKSRFDDYVFFSRIGDGNLGGKARGLAFMNSVIKKEGLFSKYPDVIVTIPSTTVLTTDIFEEFMTLNNLYSVVLNDIPDEAVLKNFLDAKLPSSISEALITISSLAKSPIAVRSSSKLEDSFYQPFAGIYNTYMVPHTKNTGLLVQLLERAIKSVYASVYYKMSKSYMSVTSNLIDEEKMGVILQAVCGTVHNNLYYPTLSGVARSLNYYPIAPEKTQDGIVDVAFGLGKLIVDGSTCLRFSPKHPKRIIQLANPESALKNTQKYFYALDLNAEAFIPSTSDSVNLQKLRISDAENNPSLSMVTSTYDFENNVLRDGNYYEGKKVVTFSGILNHNQFPLAEILNDLLSISKEAMNSDVEIEFAANLNTPEGEPKILNYLQVRPIVSVDKENIDLEGKINKSKSVLYSRNAMGNGTIRGISDIIYIKPQSFEPSNNNKLVKELGKLNEKFLKENKNYILIGPGRWGSSDPWLGIPVKWPEISAARVIVESGLEHYRVDPSQGTHFFHNLTSFGVGYFTINPYIDDGFCDFEFLDSLSSGYESDTIRHVKTEKYFKVLIDGRKNQGLILKP
ncbi:MAG: phosphoenolpyruvate synthase [Bacteroidales bacterium]|nr:phosphoenolpyruvate synthase [Bacteroidales bacterium]MBN2819321.1 phosphoenolpyruvate synthase [Bacteroidales bacterium]